MPFDVTGAIDLHVHCGPEGIPRKFDAISMARHVKASGMRSVVMKSHFVETSGWAQMAYRETGVRLCGSVTLNHYVGGINPIAVLGALGPSDEQGCFLKVVWLPTVHADAHICAHCAAGDKFDIPAEWAGGVLPAVARPINSVPKISILAPDVQDNLKGVLDLVAKHDLVLATGHVGPAECFHVMELAKRAGVKKVVITHAQYAQPGLQFSEMKSLAALGAYIELCYVLIDMALVPAPEVARAFKEVGAERIVLSTDVGQVDRPSPGDSLVKFGDALLSEGVSRADIDMAMKRTPQALVGFSG
jgi:hypothetical protein